MGSTNPLEIQVRGSRAAAQGFGKPIAGQSGSISCDGTDKTAQLVGGYSYLIQVKTADAFIAIDADSTVAANQLLVRQNAYSPLIIRPGQTGSSPVLHATGTNAVVYYTAIDDVG